MSTVNLDKQLLMEWGILEGAGHEYVDTDFNTGEEHVLRVISDEITASTRWSTWHQVVFEWDGTLYRAEYSQGATEQQDERPWQDYTHITATLVKPVQKIITVYEPL